MDVEHTGVRPRPELTRVCPVSTRHGRIAPCRCPAPEHGLASTASQNAGHHQQLWIDRGPMDHERPGTTIDLGREPTERHDGRASWRLPASGCSTPSAWCSAWRWAGSIDRALGTLPLFLFLGLIAGIAMGVLATRAEWKRYF